MTKTAAKRVARHLVGQVHRVAASRSGDTTWGYNYAAGERIYRTASGGRYHDAVAARSEHIAELAAELMAGEAAGWATAEFHW